MNVCHGPVCLLQGSEWLSWGCVGVHDQDPEASPWSLHQVLCAPTAFCPTLGCFGGIICLWVCPYCGARDPSQRSCLSHLSSFPSTSRGIPFPQALSPSPPTFSRAVTSVSPSLLCFQHFSSFLFSVLQEVHIRPSQGQASQLPSTSPSPPFLNSFLSFPL